MIQLENNPKLGYYMVGDKKFFAKPQALVEATTSGHFPEWHFNRPVFENITWDQEPETDLRMLYRLRAQQLREKYDWIRVEASGGGDSTTAIFSFLLNGIHLDEVYQCVAGIGIKAIASLGTIRHRQVSILT